MELRREQKEQRLDQREQKARNQHHQQHKLHSSKEYKLNIVGQGHRVKRSDPL